MEGIGWGTGWTGLTSKPAVTAAARPAAAWCSASARRGSGIAAGDVRPRARASSGSALRAEAADAPYLRAHAAAAVRPEGGAAAAAASAAPRSRSAAGSPARSVASASNAARALVGAAGTGFGGFGETSAATGAGAGCAAAAARAGDAFCRTTARERAHAVSRRVAPGRDSGERGIPLGLRSRPGDL